MITLNDILKNMAEPLSVGFIKNLLRQSDLLKLIPVVDTDVLKVVGSRWQTLPATGKRKLGAAYTESSGMKEEVEEGLFIYGGDLAIDRVLAKVKNRFVDELTDQVAMKARSLASTINYDFINGDHALDVDGMEGLKKRVSNMPGRMTIDLAGSGDSLKVLNSAANEHLLVDALHEAIWKIGGGQQGEGPVKGALLMNETSVLGISKALRRLGLLDTTQDNYERMWESFKGFALIDVGLMPDQSTAIITDTEDPGDAGNDSSSIYAVKFGEDDGVSLLQLKGTTPEAYDPIAKGEGGIANQGPAYARRIDWVIGARAFGSYSIARIKGFKMAAS